MQGQAALALATGPAPSRLPAPRRRDLCSLDIQPGSGSMFSGRRRFPGRVCPRGLPGGHSWQPWGPAQGLSPLGLPPCQEGVAPQCIFLPWFVLPGEGAFPALPWADLVAPCWRRCAALVGSREGLGSASHGVWAPVAGAWPGQRQEGRVVQRGGRWRLRRSKCWSVSTQGFLRPSASWSRGSPPCRPPGSPSRPRRVLAGAEQLGCAAGVLAGKAQRGRPLHKAALFRTNPPRIGLHFCQVIHQHVNGKGWSPLNQ